MFIRFGFEISITCTDPVPMLLALCTHPEVKARIIGNDHVRSTPAIPMGEYRDRFDNRITRIVAPKGKLTLWSDAIAEVSGQPDIVAPAARQVPVEDLPSETLTFLTASRYCDTDKLGEFAWSRFGSAPDGWQRVQAICDFVHQHTTFGYQFSRPTKTAGDVFHEKTGVCRDFAHLAVALCRAMNIPARYASGYLGDIGVPKAPPDDFCAWFEAYLDGRWYTFDARYNEPRIGRLLMVRGHDAADVAMITSFGVYALDSFKVWAEEVPGATGDAELLARLETRPDVEALTLASSGRIT